MIRTVSALSAALAAAACSSPPPSDGADSPAPAMAAEASMNRLSEAENAAGWRLLFDGRTLNGWRVYQSQAQPAGWFVRDGALMKDRATEDILTVDQFGDFELVFDWRVSTRGNSGVFYRATEEYEKVYWSATEYQLLDDANAPDGRNRLTSAGANYGLYPAPAGSLKPAGEWNTTRIVARGPRVEHWLNGTKLLEYEYGSADWEAKVKASKFAAWPNYGRARRGHVAIQGDHGGELALRNIRVREL